LADLFPPDTLLVLPEAVHVEPELQRTWDEAQSHLDLARRRGEDVAPRYELFAEPAHTLAALDGFGRISVVPRGEASGVNFGLVAPDAVDRDIDRLRRIVRDGTPTVILCDNQGQSERLDELLNEGTRSPSPAALVTGV